MPTNLAIDDKLIEEARLVGQHRTKKAVVTEALLEYIQRRKQVKIIRRRGRYFILLILLVLALVLGYCQIIHLV